MPNVKHAHPPAGMVAQILMDNYAKGHVALNAMGHVIPYYKAVRRSKLDLEDLRSMPGIGHVLRDLSQFSQTWHIAKGSLMGGFSVFLATLNLNGKRFRAKFAHENTVQLIRFLDNLRFQIRCGNLSEAIAKFLELGNVEALQAALNDIPEDLRSGTPSTASDSQASDALPEGTDSIDGEGSSLATSPRHGEASPTCTEPRSRRQQPRQLFQSCSSLMDDFGCFGFLSDSECDASETSDGSMGQPPQGQPPAQAWQGQQAQPWQGSEANALNDGVCRRRRERHSVVVPEQGAEDPAHLATACRPASPSPTLPACAHAPATTGREGRLQQGGPEEEEAAQEQRHTCPQAGCRRGLRPASETCKVVFVR